jgi:hypothetical protein
MKRKCTNGETSWLFFLTVLGLALMASSLLGRFYTTTATLQPVFYSHLGFKIYLSKKFLDGFSSVA